MKRLLLNSVLAFSLVGLIGCGGGGGSSNSSSNSVKEPVITLSSDKVVLNQGEVTTIKGRISNMPKDSSEFDVSEGENYSRDTVDFVTYEISSSNNKEVDILIYGANAGASTIKLVADNSKESTKYIDIEVKPLDPNIDNSDGNIDIDNRSSEKRQVSVEDKSGTCLDSDIQTSILLKLDDSSCSDSYITDTTLSFSKESYYYDPSINLKFVRYNSSGIKSYAKEINSFAIVKEDGSEEIPSSAKSINGMSFAFKGIEIDKNYKISLDTDICNPVFSYSISNICSDGDGDGVSDNLDYCPDTNTTKAFVDERGCFIDDDKDGVLDINDKCLNTPSGEKVDADGCSDSQKDDDGDGVTNDKDQCPNTASGVTVDANGCEVVVNPTPTDSGGNPIPSTGPTILPTGIVPTDPDTDEFPCEVVNGYVKFVNSIKDSFGVGDENIYFRATTSYDLEFFYKKPTVDERGLRLIDLSIYTIEETNANFSLKIDSSLADGTKFYVKDTSITNGSNCFKGYFPNEADIQKGIFPNKTLIIIE